VSSLLQHRTLKLSGNTRRSEVARAINQEMPLVVRTITDALSGHGTGSPQEKEQEAAAGFKCLEAWIDWGLTAE
jgi:hypothetical protein